jgi:hypothetical protein
MIVRSEIVELLHADRHGEANRRIFTTFRCEDASTWAILAVDAIYLQVFFQYNDAIITAKALARLIHKSGQPELG